LAIATPVVKACFLLPLWSAFRTEVEGLRTGNLVQVITMDDHWPIPVQSTLVPVQERAFCIYFSQLTGLVQAVIVVLVESVVAPDALPMMGTVVFPSRNTTKAAKAPFATVAGRP
jgi:hypothetical protein